MASVIGSILDDWGITVDELTAAVRENPSLKGLIIGYVAEFKLRSQLALVPELTLLGKDDDHDRLKKGDLNISYGDQAFRIEVKSLQTNSIKRKEDGTRSGKAQVDASDRRTVKFPGASSVETTLLKYGEFDILAVNMFGFDDEWEFAFAHNRDLPHSSYKKYTEAQQRALIASLVEVSKPIKAPFTHDLRTLLDELVAERRR